MQNLKRDASRAAGTSLETCGSRRCETPVGLSVRIVLVALGFALTGAQGSHASDFERDAGPALALSAEARAAIARVHGLNRLPPPAELHPADQRLRVLDRATRRVKALLVDALRRTESLEQQEAMALLRAEWARWQQLRSEVDADGGSTKRLRRGRSRKPLAQELGGLEKVMRREIAAAEELNGQIVSTDDRAARQKSLDRVRARPEDPSSRFPTPMLSTVIRRDAAAEPEDQSPPETLPQQASSVAKLPRLERRRESGVMLAPFSDMPPDPQTSITREAALSGAQASFVSEVGP